MKRLPNFLLMMLTAVLLATFITSCSESGSDSDPSSPTQPQTPVADGDWQVVPASGGTIEKGDITITFPSGTFPKDVKVAVTEVNSNIGTNSGAVSKFYQITLPINGTAKDFTITLNSAETANCVGMVLQSPGWDCHTGEISNMEISLDTHKSNGKYSAIIPKVDDATVLNTQPFFTVGLVQKSDINDTKETRQSTRADSNFKFKVCWDSETDFKVDILNPSSIDYTNDMNAQMQYLRDFLEIYIPKEVSTLHDHGFKLPQSTVTYQFENFNILQDNEWGCYKNGLFFTSYGYVRLNHKKFVNFYKNGSLKEDALELRQTIIHESLHAITDKVYDKRTAPEKNREGLKG